MIATKLCLRMLLLCPCTLCLQCLHVGDPLTGLILRAVDRYPSVYRVQAYWLCPAMRCNVSQYGYLRSRFVKIVKFWCKYLHYPKKRVDLYPSKINKNKTI